MRRFRQFSCLAMVVGLTGLVALLSWTLLRFSTPKPMLALVGPVEDFPPGSAPRLFSERGEPFFVLNVNGELIALSARPVHHIRCIVRWSTVANLFIDPCLGTHFSIRGEYRGKGPPGELRRLPVELRDGQVWVNLGYS